MAFTLLKTIGAAYLVYLAWLSFKAKPETQQLEQKNTKAKASALQMYSRGIIMNVSNPKVTIFFLAFLPQFINNNLNISISMQILQLGALFMLSTLIVFGGIAVFSGFVGRKLQQSAMAQVIINKAAALIFVGLAIKLITSKQ